VSICQTAEAIDFETVGQVIAQAVAESDLRVVLIASGALSHTFHHLRTLRDHEAAAKNIFIRSRLVTPTIGVIDAWKRGDHATVVNEFFDFLAVRQRPTSATTK